MTIQGPGDYDPQEPSLQINLGDHLTRHTEVVTNLNQRVLMIGRDRLELTLSKEVPKYAPFERVLSVFALVVGLWTAVVTSDFKEAFTISATSWRTIFVFSALLASGWSLWSFWRLIFRRRTISDIVAAIENDSST